MSIEMCVVRLPGSGALTRSDGRDPMPDRRPAWSFQLYSSKAKSVSDDAMTLRGQVNPVRKAYDDAYRKAYLIVTAGRESRTFIPATPRVLSGHQTCREMHHTHGSGSRTRASRRGRSLRTSPRRTRCPARRAHRRRASAACCTRAACARGALRTASSTESRHQSRTLRSARGQRDMRQRRGRRTVYVKPPKEIVVRTEDLA